MELPKIEKIELDEFSKAALDKYGIEQCNKAFKLFETHRSIKKVAEIMELDRIDVGSMMTAHSIVTMQEQAPGLEKAIKEYNDNRHKLPDCPKKTCSGKLHPTVSNSKELENLYHCDGCKALFRPKAK